jgi:hypothetical protein
MRRRVGPLAFYVVLVIVLPVASALAQGAPDVTPRGRTLGFVSPPAAGEPRELALEFLRARGRAAGLNEADLADVVVTDQVPTRHNGATHVYLRQRHRGIDVLGTESQVTVAADGRLIGVHQAFAANLAARVDTSEPGMTPAEAVGHAARALGLAPGEPLRELEPAGGPARSALLSDGGVSLDPIPAKLVYVHTASGAIRLAWDLVLRLEDGVHWWNLQVDATTGAILDRSNWIDSDSYRVFAFNLESPDEGAQTLESDPASSASPFGWHDTNGAAGAEFTDTRGNNVFAQDDTDANNSGGTRPSGGGSLDFDFAVDFGQPPSSQLLPAITNLFYWNNILHDVFYEYGFDEPGGNFQENNYGNGGSGSDAVNADAQDGSGLNNANFGTPQDGSNPRMQMFLFQYPGLSIASPSSIAGAIKGGTAAFGPAITATPVAGDLVQALDAATGADPSTTDGCTALTNASAINGNIALIDRGECDFAVKVLNAQNAGAVAAVIVNNQGNEVIDMGGTEPLVAIPSVFIGQDNGDLIETELGGTVAASIALVVKDGDFDNGIIIHEYGHGVSNRLVGGPSNVGCLDLSQSSGMGEGWSDFLALALTHKPGDTRTTVRPMGSFAVGHLGPPRSGPGIRNLPYSTDLLVNPQTYETVESTNQPHGIGEVWVLPLWEMYWNLVERWGFDPDLYAGSGGNNLAVQLVIDGMKQAACEPSLLDGRDAILAADNMNNGGANQCRIWRAFARRGMGVNADAGNLNPPNPKVVEDFTVPEACASTCGNDVIEADEVCDGTSAAACTAGCNSLCFCLPDADADGLDDALEETLGTDPALADTDGDGLSDGEEVNVLGSDPLDPNSPVSEIPVLSGWGLLVLVLVLGAYGRTRAWV